VTKEVDHTKNKFAVKIKEPARGGPVVELREMSCHAVNTVVFVVVVGTLIIRVVVIAFRTNAPRDWTATVTQAEIGIISVTYAAITTTFETTVEITCEARRTYHDVINYNDLHFIAHALPTVFAWTASGMNTRQA